MSKDRIEFARDLLEVVVEADRDDFIADTADLRSAFHYAQSLFALHYWTHSELIEKGASAVVYAGVSHPFSTEFDYLKLLTTFCPEYGYVRDLANAAKHRILTRRPSTPAKHAANTHSSGTGYGQESYGGGPFGGTPTVKIQVSKTDFIYLSDVAEKSYQMWLKIFTENPL